MAKAVAARQFGDEYQQLVFWKYALRMLSGNYEIDSIKYEDDEIKSYDDVVIIYAKPQKFRDTVISKEYIQVKFHMRNDNLFTLDNLLDPAFINAEKNSLLDNVVSAYRKLGNEFDKSVFVIYSVWDIAQGDILNKLVNNTSRTIELEKLFDGTSERSNMGKARKKLCSKLSVNESELKSILRQIRLESSQESLIHLKDALNQKLETLGLQVISGSKYTNPYAQLIQELNKAGHTSFSKNFLEEQILNEGLYSGKRDKIEAANKADAKKRINPSLSFIQNGDGNTQIGHIEQQIVNINKNSFNIDYMPRIINTQYYNLFVVEQNDFDGIVSILRENALDDYTDLEIRQKFAKPKLAALDEIKQLPALFLTRNMYGNRTDMGHRAGVGYVIDVRELENIIRVQHSPLKPIAQQHLNEMAEELHLKTASERNELDVVHWSIKHADLLQILNNIENNNSSDCEI